MKITTVVRQVAGVIFACLVSTVFVNCYNAKPDATKGAETDEQLGTSQSDTTEESGKWTQLETGQSDTTEESGEGTQLETGQSDTTEEIETEEIVMQSPVTIEIINGTDKYQFLTDPSGRPSPMNWIPPIQIVSEVDGHSQKNRISSPGCGMILCEETEPNSESCCADCGAELAMTVIAPGDSFTIEWDGMLGEINETHCSECACYDRTVPTSGKYRLEVCAHDSAQCAPDFNDCTIPTVSTNSSEIYPVGDPICQTMDFEVPHNATVMTFTILTE